MGVARRSFCKRWAAALLGCMALMMLTQGAAASAAPPLERLSSFGPDGTEASDFTKVGAIAVDEEDQVAYVLDFGGALYKFNLKGQPVDFGGSDSDIEGNRLGGLDPYDPASPGGGGVIGIAQVAVAEDTHVVYVTEQHAIRAFEENGEPHEFTAGPGAGSSEIPGFGELFGVGVDGNGNVYGSDYAGVVKIYSPTGAFITSFSVTEPYNLVVGSDGTVFVSERNKVIRRFTPDIFPVTENTVYSGADVVEANAVIVGLDIDSVSHDIYALETFVGHNWVQKYAESGEALESFGRPETPTEQDGLGGGSQGIAVLDAPYEVQEGEQIQLYVGDSAEGESKVTTLGSRNIPGPPIVSRLRATDVTADSAVLRGVISPALRPTTYRFEYGLGDCSLSVCTSIPVGGASIGEESEETAVAQTVVGLASNTLYHYRLVAENVFGEEEESRTFTTQTMGSSFQLSDNRAWEMVSPSNKRGGTLVSPSLGHVQAAAGGGGVAYLSKGSIEADPDGNRSFEVSSILAKRGAGGWESKDITPANSRRVPFRPGNQGEFKLFDPELSSALLDPHDGSQLSPKASERTPYLWEDANPPVYEPLVTGKEDFANVPPGTEFGGDPQNTVGPIRISGANDDVTDVVLSSDVPLVAGAPSEPVLYHWRAGQLSPVSVLPSDEGGEMVLAQLGSGGGSVRHAISEDGDRIFWGRGTYGAGSGNLLTGLYLRDVEVEQTVRLDVVQPGASGLGEARPAFQGASSDGTVVFFTDSQQLTVDASTSGSDLYRCEIPSGSSLLGCTTLNNITAEAVGEGESAEIMGVVSGISHDATLVYFVARGVLDAVPNRYGDGAEPGQPNLYRWQQGEGVRFVARLTQDDAPDWGKLGLASQLSATISPDGRHFAFMSEKDLTGQGNLDADTGNAVQEAFLYDAQSDQLLCVSCNPTGAAPVGQVSAGFSQMVDPNGQWGGKWVAAILPQPRTVSENYSIHQPRTVLDSGRLFFNALADLVPSDSNNQWDVYQFEPVGLGSCSASSSGSSTVRSGEGCISLISSGTGDEESVFLDASVSGDDIFFLSPAQLSVLDEDRELDLYDARVDGTPAVLSPSSGCLGEACRSEAAPPRSVEPGSALFRGLRNIKNSKKCPKGKRRVRRGGKVQCVPKKKHRKHGQSKKQGSRAGERNR